MGRSRAEARPGGSDDLRWNWIPRPPDRFCPGKIKIRKIPNEIKASHFGFRNRRSSADARDSLWQSAEASPEILVRFGNHGWSRRFPCAMSSSTLDRNWSGLPAAMSRFICSSHSLSCQLPGPRTTFARSASVSEGIAALISATVLRWKN